MVSHFYWATVVDNIDPDGLSRVKVARMVEEENVTEWVPVLTPYGGGDTGLSFMPEVDDQVLVFSPGTADLRKAIIGTVWSKDTPPPETNENSAADLNKDGENSLRFLKSRAGNLLVFDDTAGEEKIQVITADGKSRLEFDHAGESVSLTTECDLTIKAEKDVLVEAEEVSITSDGEFNISADEYQVDAADNFDLDSGGDLDVKGSNVGLN